MDSQEINQKGALFQAIVLVLYLKALRYTKHRMLKPFIIDKLFAAPFFFILCSGIYRLKLSYSPGLGVIILFDELLGFVCSRKICRGN